MPTSVLHEPVLRWYAGNARDLPWRRPGTPAWGVVISEFMLQQTPVARVLEPYARWLEQWPTPAALAADAPAAAVRAWGRLGYPRRALRLHAAATAIVLNHDGVVPSAYDDLRSLPGVGDYTAAAVASFAYGGREIVLDTNVRRVFARAIGGTAQPAPSLTAAERRLAEALLPEDGSAATWAVATMELGATVCTARAPACDRCPIRPDCLWHSRGMPAYGGPVRRTQQYAGTDRQVRGRILAVLRDAHAPVTAAELADSWPDAVQRHRALQSLLEDGLVDALAADAGYVLGGTPTHGL